MEYPSLESQKPHHRNLQTIIKKCVEQQQYNSNEHQYTTQNKHMIKEFTPLRLCLLGSTSNGLGLSIMLKLHQKCVYNAQMPLKSISMSS